MPHHHPRHDDSAECTQPNDGGVVQLIPVAGGQIGSPHQLLSGENDPRQHQQGIPGHAAMEVIGPLAVNEGLPALMFFVQETGGQIISDRSHVHTVAPAAIRWGKNFGVAGFRTQSESPDAGRRRQKWCWSTQLCMVTAAAAEALSERVEPNWLISTMASAAATAASESPGPSCPNSITQRSGNR